MNRSERIASLQSDIEDLRGELESLANELDSLDDAGEVPEEMQPMLRDLVAASHRAYKHLQSVLGHAHPDCVEMERALEAVGLNPLGSVARLESCALF